MATNSANERRVIMGLRREVVALRDRIGLLEEAVAEVRGETPPGVVRARVKAVAIAGDPTVTPERILEEDAKSGANGMPNGAKSPVDESPGRSPRKA